MSLGLINNSKIEILKDRAEMLAMVRQFFQERAVLEVDCPLLTKNASIDAHIDLIEAKACGQRAFLHTSPEYAMKRLLSQGMGDIYQLGHVFRDSEISAKHNPEFMMIEWYRLEFSFNDMIEETVELITLFLNQVLKRFSYEMLSYRDAFIKYVGIDYCKASVEELLNFLKEKEVEVSNEIPIEKDALLNIILAIFIEPHLGQGNLTVLRDYPASQAALAKTIQKKDELVAERFEVYYQGLELANGYHELIDAYEQKKRLIAANLQRIELGKNSLPLDECFIAALEKGVPQCCGVAVGFDRLMMLRHLTSEISKVIAFGWHEI